MNDPGDLTVFLLRPMRLVKYFAHPAIQGNDACAGGRPFALIVDSLNRRPRVQRQPAAEVKIGRFRESAARPEQLDLGHRCDVSSGTFVPWPDKLEVRRSTHLAAASRGSRCHLRRTETMASMAPQSTLTLAEL